MSTRPEQSPPVTFLGEFSKKLVTNTFFNLLGRSWSFLVTLLLTPYLLRNLDKTEFGAWVLLSVFTTSFNLLDLGLGSSFVKYIAAYYTYEEYDRINEVLFSGLAFYALFGATLTGLGLALQKPLFTFFNIGAVGSVFPMVLVACALQNVAQLFLSVFKGIQRMDISNSIEIRMSIVNVVGTVVFLEAGLGIWGLAANSVLVQVVAIVWNWWTVRNFMPKLRLGWHLNSHLLKDMFSYGAKIQVSQLGNLVCFNVDKLIISRFLGVASVSFYEVAARLTSFMRAVPLVMLSALIPATSELGARNDRERIRQTYYVTSKYVCMLTVALVAFVVLEASSLVHFWIGNGFEISVVLIQVLAIGYGMNVMGGAASQTGAGVGRPEFDMKSTVLLTVINPILSVLLVRQYGSAGAAAGTSIALVVSAVYLLVIFHREYLEDSVWSVFRNIQLRPIIAASISALAIAGLHNLVPQFADAEGLRYLIPVKLAADLALFTSFYMALLIGLRQITLIDWNNFVGLMAFGFEFLRHPLRERVKIYR
jgi:O-antigen/teichoic acid export membrane protein